MLNVIAHASHLKVRKKAWMSSLEWKVYIVFTDHMSETSPKFTVLPKCPPFIMNLGAGKEDKTQVSQGPPKTERYTNGNN